MRRTTSFWLAALAGAALVAAGITPARAQDPDDLQRGVARISLAEGDVSVQRGDSSEWVAAAINAPLLSTDRISTGPNSRAEVEFDAGNVLRIGGDAQVTLSQLEYNRYQMAVGRGTVTFRVLRASNADVEVDTPNVSVRPSKQGSYRIAVNDAGESEVTARAGDVEVFTPRGSQWVYSGQTMMARGSESDPEFQIVQAAAYDEWDRWSDSRDRTVSASASYQYVPPGVYGTENLDPYGSWVNVPAYGNVWRPTVAADWAPYRDGRWVWIDWYGWTWVSDDPWGWAPYHYGRWFNEPAYGWCWYPGALGVRHYWSPALVAFFGFGGDGGFGFGNVGWVPLAPYEVLHPWWGRPYYGRGASFNRSINAVNVNINNVYRNSRVRNGITAVSGADFQAGRFNHFAQASGNQLARASFANGRIPVAPERTNLRFSDRQNAFVPRSTATTRVFSARQPSPVQRLSFDEQRRGFGQPGTGAGQQPAMRSNESAGGGGGRSFGQNASQPAYAPPAGRSGTGSWQRFGEPRSAQVSPRAEQPRVEPATPPASRGWSRFGDPGAAARTDYRQQPQPQSQFRSEDRSPAVNTPYNSNGGSRPESLRITPPVVRERSFGGGGGSRPQVSAPSGGGFSGSRGAPQGSSGGARSRGPQGGGGGGNRGGGGGRRR